jgi:hypothetical protein
MMPNLKFLNMFAQTMYGRTGHSDLFPFSKSVGSALRLTASNETNWSRGRSVSIVSGYGLHDRAKEVRFPAEARVSFF